MGPGLPGGQEGVGIAGEPVRGGTLQDGDRIASVPQLSLQARGLEQQRPQKGQAALRRDGHGWKLVLLLLAAACGGGRAAPPVGAPLPTVGSGGPQALNTVWPLERLGPSPTDTTVRFTAVGGRTVVLRHPRPDLSIFAIITFPPGSMRGRQGDSVTVHIQPTPGRYGFTLVSPDSFATAAVGTFSYAVHFAAPEGSQARYPTPTRFEAAMGGAVMVDSATVRFLSSDRPAGDMLRFAILAPGTYLLAAPR